jgi:outer membrane lipoprotein carrier protein
LLSVGVEGKRARMNPGGLVLRILAIVLCSAIAPPAFADPEVDTIIAGVEAAYKDVKTLRADFVQVTRSKAMGDETRQRGQVHLKRPRMMRWAFTQPAGKEFVTNGETMWVWSAPENQAIISKGMASGGQGMSQLLDDLNRLGDLFDVEILDNKGRPASILLGLKPKGDAGFQSLKLRLAKKDYGVQEVTMIDAFGNEVALSFSAVKNNAEIADSMFNFVVPDGAQVLNADGP